MNKKGFEVTVNFLVMLILALAIFAVGVYFAGKVFGEVNHLGTELDTQTKAEIEAKLRSPTALVAIGINRKEIKRGSHDSFGLGVTNRDTTSGEFYASIQCVLGQDKDGAKIDDTTCEECCGKWIMTPEVKVGVLAPNEFSIPAIFFNVNKKAASGSYVYNVQVYKEESGKAKHAYDSVKKIYVDVP